MALTCPMIAALSDKRQRDFLDIDEIDGRVWDDRLRCWVLREHSNPKLDLSALQAKFAK